MEVEEVDVGATAVGEEVEVEEVVHLEGVVGAEGEGLKKEIEMIVLADKLTSESCKKLRHEKCLNFKCSREKYCYHCCQLA